MRYVGPATWAVSVRTKGCCFKATRWSDGYVLTVSPGKPRDRRTELASARFAPAPSAVAVPCTGRVLPPPWPPDAHTGGSIPIAGVPRLCDLRWERGGRCGAECLPLRAAG